MNSYFVFGPAFPPGYFTQDTLAKGLRIAALRPLGEEVEAGDLGFIERSDPHRPLVKFDGHVQSILVSVRDIAPAPN